MAPFYGAILWRVRHGHKVCCISALGRIQLIQCSLMHYTVTLAGFAVVNCTGFLSRDVLTTK